MVDRAAVGGVVDGAEFYGDHRAGFGSDIRVDLFLGTVVGGRRAFIWVGGTISGDVAWQLGTAGVHVRLRGAGAFDLLQFCSNCGEDFVP